MVEHRSPCVTYLVDEYRFLKLVGEPDDCLSVLLLIEELSPPSFC